MRQIVLDTETTGLNPDEGHRVIEIGAVELVKRKITGKRFHVYLNPQREIDAGAVEVHGLSSAFLSDKPLFEEIAEDFLGFVDDSELVIHNAPFDMGFLNAELSRWNKECRLQDHCRVLDTLMLARKMHPGQRNGLDALCKRYRVDNSHRELHGALLDAEILAEVYLAMTGGQASMALEFDPIQGSSESYQSGGTKITSSSKRPGLPILRCNEEEERFHLSRLNAIDKASGGRCLWKKILELNSVELRDSQPCA